MELDRDLLARSRPAPDVNRPFALHHHVAAENSRQFGFTASRDGALDYQQDEGENAKISVEPHSPQS